MQLDVILSKSKTVSPEQYPELRKTEVIVCDHKGRIITESFKLYDGYSFTASSEDRLRRFCERYNEVSLPNLIVRVYDYAIYLCISDPYQVALTLERATW